MSDSMNPVLLKVSAQAALLGAVTGNLAAVTVKVDAKAFQMKAFFFSDPTDDEVELISEASTRILADLSWDIMENLEILTLNNFVPGNGGDLVFLRAEAEKTLV